MDSQRKNYNKLVVYKKIKHMRFYWRTVEDVIKKAKESTND